MRRWRKQRLNFRAQFVVARARGIAEGGAGDDELRPPGLRAALIPVTSDRFRSPGGDLLFMSQDEFELHFLSQDAFELKSMEGQTTRYARARPYSPTPSDLQAFAGRYASDEIGSVFRIVPGKDGLMVHLEG